MADTGLVISRLVLVISLLCPALAGAEQTDGVETTEESTHLTASGALGVGIFDNTPSTTLDIGLDISRSGFALGLGGRVRFLIGEGMRMADWDEPAEGARFLRYATYRHLGRAPGQPSWSVALGPLSDIRLGNGAIVSGFTDGLNVDHGTAGLHFRLSGERVDAEGMVDGITNPWLFAGRTAVAVASNLRVAGTVAVDRNAPTASGGTQPVGVFGSDISWQASPSARGLAGGLSLELVHILATGSGAHLGAHVELLRGGFRSLSLGGELRLGSQNYLPGWFSPLYQIERAQYGLEHAMVSDTQLAAVRAADVSGVGAEFSLAASDSQLGEASLSYELRPGTHDLFVARALLPSFHRVQVGGWLVAERRDQQNLTGAMVLEVRVRLPHSLYLTAELARLYRSNAMAGAGVSPLWMANLAIGAIVGE